MRPPRSRDSAVELSLLPEGAWSFIDLSLRAARHIDDYGLPGPVSAEAFRGGSARRRGSSASPLDGGSTDDRTLGARLRADFGDAGLFTVQFDHPAIPASQSRAQIEFSTASYVKEVSRARTFGFMRDLEYMRERNLGLGGSMDNAIVLDEFRVLNEDGLRYTDEFVRHKILDAIGDLYLAGRPILGAYEGFKSGHALNNKLVRALLAEHGRSSDFAHALGSDTKSKVSLGCYALAVPVALWQPLLSLALIALVAAIWIVPDRRFSRIVP